MGARSLYFIKAISFSKTTFCLLTVSKNQICGSKPFFQSDKKKFLSIPFLEIVWQKNEYGFLEQFLL